MTPNASVSGPNFRHDVVLEEALQEVVRADTRAGNVVNDAEEVLGSITIDQIIAGIARPKVESNGEAKYK